jgi:hypothetical protein
MFVFSVLYTVYGVLFSPLWLKSVPGWPAISVSTWQQSRVGQIVWFGSLSAISQLASRGGGMGSWATLCLHSVTQPYTNCPRWREQGGGLCSLPLGIPQLIELYNVHLASRAIRSLKTGLMTSTSHLMTGWPPQTHKVWLLEKWNWFWTESFPTAVDSPWSQSFWIIRLQGLIWQSMIG